MPNYMKIDGVVGPLMYDKSKGWFEVLSIAFGRVQVAPEESADALFVTAHAERALQVLVDLRDAGTKQDITIVLVKDATRPAFGPPGPPIELARYKLSAARIFSVQIGGGAGQLLTLIFDRISVESGTRGHAKLVLRPQDWGTVKASAYFNQTGALA